MPFGKIRFSLEKIRAAHQAAINARESVAGVYAYMNPYMDAYMNQEIRNHHNNNNMVDAAAEFVKKAVEAGDTAVRMDAPFRVKEVIRLAQEKTLQMEMLINEAIGGYEMKELLGEATTAALLAEQEWRKAKEMSEEQMGGRRRSNRSNRSKRHRTLRSKRNRTHRK